MGRRADWATPELPPRRLVSADASGGPVDVLWFERPVAGPTLRVIAEPGAGRAELEQRFTEIMIAIFEDDRSEA